jgi:hypothetical protein
MLIANPIYDPIFKSLMENKPVAKFFISTLIGEQVEDLALVPQEYSYKSRVKKKKEKKEENDKEEWDLLSLIRFDFVATIRTEKGEYKKVYVEIQKTNKPTNLMRFRTYLGEQYKKIDVVKIASGEVEKALPIISIYLLGFKLPKIKAAAIKVYRTYFDMIEHKEIKQKNKLIESLTHDGYFVQIPYIKGKPRTLLENILSLFEQRYFINDKSTIKKYEYPIEDENMRLMVEILEHAAADEHTRRLMELAWFDQKDEEELERMETKLKEAVKVLVEKEKTIEESKKNLEESKKTIEESKKTIEEKDDEITRLKEELLKIKQQK